MLQPHCRRTWAWRGRTPIQRVWARHDRRSVIGCVGLSPARQRVAMAWRMHPYNIDIPTVVAFVRQQVAQHGRILLILDRWSVHLGAVRQLRRELGQRLHVEWLPAYAPELNPAEQIWNHAKYTDLANFVPDDIVHLARRVGLSFYHQSRDPHLLQSYFKTAKLRI